MLRPLILFPVVFLLASLSAPALGAGLQVCVVKTKKGLREPPTLTALLVCQDDSRRDYRLNWKRTHNKPIPAKDFGEISEYQRDEVRAYLRRNPERAMIEEEEKPRLGDGGTEPVLNEARIPAKDRTELRKLEKLLKTKSMDGQLGVTPEMVQDILKFLLNQQGGASLQMRELLDSLAKDGPNLTHGSMLRLKKASRKAASEGLELGVKPDLERWLLDPRTDPKTSLPLTPSN